MCGAAVGVSRSPDPTFCWLPNDCPLKPTVALINRAEYLGSDACVPEDQVVTPGLVIRRATEAATTQGIVTGLILAVRSMKPGVATVHGRPPGWNLLGS